MDKYEEPKLIKIDKDVYGIIDLFHVSKKSTTNSGIIFTKNSVIFIDSGMRIPSAEYILDFASKIYPQKKNIYLILTHHHSDHSFGMKVFKEKGAKIIAHKKTDDFLKNDNGKYKQFVLSKFFKNPEIGEKILGDVHIFPADQKIEEDTLLKIDDVEIHLIMTPGHTESDISVYHKESKTLFAGDTIYESSPPNTRFGNYDMWVKWKEKLEMIKKMDINFICPGHGKVTDKSIIDSNIKYLEKIINENK